MLRNVKNTLVQEELGPGSYSIGNTIPNELIKRKVIIFDLLKCIQCIHKVSSYCMLIRVIAGTHAASIYPINTQIWGDVEAGRRFIGEGGCEVLGS